MQEYETLKRLGEEADEDVAKAIGGNKAAGTRVRKKMQEIKAAAQEVRKKILEGRETTEPGAAVESRLFRRSNKASAAGRLPPRWLLLSCHIRFQCPHNC